jgi:5-methylcytosine-specific restriction endonuclease McrA
VRLRRYRLRGSGVTATADQLRAVRELAGGVCVYCAKAQAETMDHFIPVAHGGLTEVGNMVPACVSCNSSKTANEPHKWTAKRFGLVGLAAVLEFLAQSENIGAAA